MHTMRQRLLVGVATTLALALSGCAGDDGEATDPAADTAPESDATSDDTAAADSDEPGGDAESDATTDDAAGADSDGEDDGTDGDAAAAAATVMVASSDLGDILVDGDGRTLYMFVPDDGGEPTCTDDCAQTWPVFEGPAAAGDGADDALASTVAHPSGATQVAYGGWPLYYFANDAGPGDVNGQGINDVWFAIGPDGEPIRGDAAASGGDLGY